MYQEQEANDNQLQSALEGIGEMYEDLEDVKIKLDNLIANYNQWEENLELLQDELDEVKRACKIK